MAHLFDAGPKIGRRTTAHTYRRDRATALRLCLTHRDDREGRRIFQRLLVWARYNRKLSTLRPTLVLTEAQEVAP